MTNISNNKEHFSGIALCSVLHHILRICLRHIFAKLLQNYYVALMYTYICQCDIELDMSARKVMWFEEWLLC